MHSTEEARNDGRVRVRIIHGLNISHKELTYLLQKSTSHQKPSIMRMLLGGIDWQEKTIARPRLPLIRRTIKEHLMFQICNTTFTICACYGTCKLQHKYFSNSQLLTSMTLISPSSYLKTIIKHQTSPSIQCTFYDSFNYTQLGCPSFLDQFYNHSKYHAVLKDS